MLEGPRNFDPESGAKLTQLKANLKLVWLQFLFYTPICLIQYFAGHTDVFRCNEIKSYGFGRWPLEIPYTS